MCGTRSEKTIYVVFCAATKVNENQRPYPLDETLVESRTDGINGASNEIMAGGRERLLPVIITPFRFKMISYLIWLLLLLYHHNWFL